MHKTIIITGGSQGLGFQAAKLLAKDKQTGIVIANRNKENTSKAVEQIKAETANQNVLGFPLDLGDFNSIKQFVVDFQNLNLPPLFALVNNAGVQYISKTRFTKQGYEQTFGVNHLGHFLLTHLLLSHLSENGKIINTASGVHKPELKTPIPVPVYKTAEKLAYCGADDGQKDAKELRHQGQVRYSTSKLCNVLFTYKLAKKLSKQQGPIQVLAFDPGMMPGTGLANDYPAFIRFVWKNVLPLQTLFGNRINTPKQSAKVLVDWVLNRKTDKTTAYFYVGGEEKSSRESYDKELQDDLWSFSEKQIETWLKNA